MSFVYTTRAANPVQIGLRAAVSNSPFLSRLVTTRRTFQHSTRSSFLSQQLPSVVPVSSTNDVHDEEQELNDKLVQSAFWHASSPAEVYQSRRIEFPVSRQQNAPTDAEPECELEFLESQIHGGNLLASSSSSLRDRVSHVAALTPAPRRATIPPAGRSSSTTTLHNKEKHSLEAMEEQKEQTTSSTSTAHAHVDNVRGGVVASRPLIFWETMICGAISRSVAQTIMHPANTMKTMLQSQRGTTVMELLRPSSFHRLTYGAGANFLLSVPTGALNFAVLEFVRHRMGQVVQSTPFLASRQEQLGAGLDFMSSALSTIACSVVATPQMMITDNIMAGNYPNLLKATQGLYEKQGVIAFYRGWWPGLVGKIPSYALTWTLFQQLKQVRNRISHRPARHYENSIMGCLASATTVSIMIPMDTIKTRLVTQTGGVIAGSVPYKGIIDCAVRIAKEEGMGAFYRGLPPRLVSVVPMIGIQFGVYEAMKKVMLRRQVAPVMTPKKKWDKKKLAAAAASADEPTKEEVFEGVAMEVGASHGNPIPVPHMHDHEHFDELASPKKGRTKKQKGGRQKTKVQN